MDSHPTQRLDVNTVRHLARSITMCTTRRGLDALTRLIWRTYSGPDGALEQLRIRIEAQRSILERNDPR
jgi:hypothetical protein